MASVGRGRRGAPGGDRAARPRGANRRRDRRDPGRAGEHRAQPAEARAPGPGGGAEGARGGGAVSDELPESLRALIAAERAAPDGAAAAREVVRARLGVTLKLGGALASLKLI